MSTPVPDASHAAADSDRRTVPRQRVMKSAKITFGDFVFARDCAVRDISGTGARVTVSGASEIPNEFYLVMMTNRMMHKAHVAWRRGDTLGVTFEGEPENIARTDDPRLRQFKP